MKSNNSAPAWLFSFVDLAFLLLIASTQMNGDAMPDFGEIVVPRLQASSATDLPIAAVDRWQLRIYPPDGKGTPVFELSTASTASEALEERIQRSVLVTGLEGLRSKGQGRPLLAPHEDSLSRDMLEAVALLEEIWPDQRRVTIEPRLAQQ